ncbi:MAG: hypothetical protein OEZ31_08315 [Nitrospirota bacterium]|nr:hypothetical protein [Nitrospirota bacterium]MDH5768944.1 hypothetical protein [Nitrospirota bacterium]
MSEKNLEQLVILAEMTAKVVSDGQITLMRFENGWKVMFGIPILNPEESEKILNYKEFITLKNALRHLVGEV